ncbi:MAG: hypothetical protein ACYSTF_07155 [Planctomycetota bacterium]|jgi:hypothetical protein
MSQAEPSLCGDCKFFEAVEDPRSGMCENPNLSEYVGFKINTLWPKRHVDDPACEAFVPKAG